MINLLLMEENSKVKELSKNLGFSKTWFLGKDVILISGFNKKEVLKKIKENKNKFIIVRVESEEMLRFVLEKTTAQMVFGQEMVNLKDSVHFLRGGLDQITCKIAASQGKIIGFSFVDILESSFQGKVMGRMSFNLKLCKKYGVKTFFGNFSTSFYEMRSRKDLESFFRILGGQKNIL